MDHFERLLRILGTAPKSPSLQALTELVAAHLTRIPFENISKLHYLQHYNLRALPGLEQYLDGIEHCHFGGTCYSNNYYFHLLLRNLGYQVKLCGADMNYSDVHVVNLVVVEGREYIVDAGYAAPFLEPLPRDLSQDYEVSLGRDRYLLKPQDGDGRSVMHLIRDGQLKHGYTIKPQHRAIDYFSGVIADSYRDEATFMNALLLVRFWPGRSLAIHNLTVLESAGSRWSTRQLPDRNTLVNAVAEHFAVPREITAAALSRIGEFRNAWS
ncbi:MAG: arylamine N-acetyltransferase [Candidatus Zixiibacteriota bacterium]